MKTALLILLALYLAACSIMFAFQRRFLYFPDATRTPPATAGLTHVVEREIKTPDGETIIAWYGKAAPGQPTLLYFHGNGGALETRSARFAKYLARGRGVFAMSYRGYSGSTGEPSEASNFADAKLAFDALLKERVAERDIIIYGESLGTGVATQVAAGRDVGGLILDSPFTSVLARARQLYPWLPVTLLLKDRYESDQVIGRVTVPLFILHGERDDVVPVEMGRELFALANEPKELKTIPDAGHDDHWQHGSFEAINDWIDRLRSGAVASKPSK